MVLLITGVGTLFYAAVSSVELVVEGAIRAISEGGGCRRLSASSMDITSCAATVG